MANFRTSESGKALVVVLILVNLLLIIAVLFLARRPSLDSLVPESGKTAYLMAVNDIGVPAVYTPDGIPWEVCPLEICNNPPEEQLDPLGAIGFSAFVYTQAGNGGEGSKAAMSGFFVNSAFASDGVCPVLYYRAVYGTWVPVYPPSSSDPDCPPKAK
jgi:hypothetical protein